MTRRGRGSISPRVRSGRPELQRPGVDDITKNSDTTDAPDGRASPAPWGLLLLLMAMTAIGPTTLNVLVPAIPQLARKLSAEIATVQLTISVYLLALAGGQLVMGPLS